MCRNERLIGQTEAFVDDTPLGVREQERLRFFQRQDASAATAHDEGQDRQQRQAACPSAHFLQRQGNVLSHVELGSMFDFGASAVGDLKREGTCVAKGEGQEPLTLGFVGVQQGDELGLLCHRIECSVKLLQGVLEVLGHHLLAA